MSRTSSKYLRRLAAYAAAISLLLALICPRPGFAASNTAVDAGGGGVSLAASGSVTVNGVASGNAVTSVRAEIDPNSVAISSKGNTLVYYVLPTINGGDTGLDVVAITVPAGHTNFDVTAVSIGGTALTPNCPTPGAGQFCNTNGGQLMTVALGSKVTTSLMRIEIDIAADAPGSTGSGDFMSTVDDTSTAGIAPQTTTPGDADGNTGNANSITVNVVGYAITSALAEIDPDAVAIGSHSNAFFYNILPTINGNDTGVDHVEIVTLAGYTNLNVTGASVGGSGLGSNCPTPGAGEYCGIVSGQTMTVTLGTMVTTTLTNIQVFFTTDAPTTVGTADFTSTVDDTSTAGIAPQATTSGNADGNPNNANGITVEVVGYAVTSALAEISPNAVAVGSTGNVFIYDILPEINPDDTGVDHVEIVTPAGYTNLNVTGASVGGSGLGSNCPTPGASEYCGAVSGQVLSVTFGTKVTTTLTQIQVRFSAVAPSVEGTADFTLTVDDTTTSGVAPQATTVGDADGDPNDANSMTVKVAMGADPDRSTVTVDPEIVIADGVETSTITTTLLDAIGQPAPDKVVVLSSDRNGASKVSVGLAAVSGGMDLFDQPSSPTDTNGVATGTVRSNVVGVATIAATDSTDGITVTMKPVVYFTQGVVLELVKTANKDEALVGDVVTYKIELKNTTTDDVVLVRLEDKIPPNFKYRKGSTLMNGAKADDPTGNRTLVFDIGTIPALEDSNGNGNADPGEPGYMTLSYQLIIGSGAIPRDYVNTAVAKDVCDVCLISNTDKAKVTVTLDPLFDLGTIIGKVFEDKNRDGWQDRDEPGVSEVMVALDDGTYAITDEHGRYHFPAVRPGQRLVKINIHTLKLAGTSTTKESHVLWVSPGLLAKANFGVDYIYDSESIGLPGEIGVSVDGEKKDEPVQVTGNVETMTVLFNGYMAKLPTSGIHMAVQALDEIVEIKGDKLLRPVEFQVGMPASDRIKSWRLRVMNLADEPVRVFKGDGMPPEVIRWDGQTNEEQLLEGGEIYQYQMEVEYIDGSQSQTARRVFGVNRTAIISLRLTGDAFKQGSAQLSSGATEILAEVAKVLREYPKEKITVEGHTDSTGSEEANLSLSKKRAQAATNYLVQQEEIPREQFMTRWFGETEPMASNDTPEGQEINRRVEVRGEEAEVDRARLLDQLRTEPRVRINDSIVEVDRKGRFQADVDGEALSEFEIELANGQGRALQTKVPVPKFEIVQPQGEILLTYGSTGEDYEVSRRPEEGEWSDEDVVLTYRIMGRTDPGNTIELERKPVPVQADGSFESDLHLKLGGNRYGLVVRDEHGFSRIANLLVKVSDRDESGELLIVVDPIPNLTVKFPPKGRRVTNSVLALSGVTDPGNRVEVNGQSVTVQPNGQFATTVTLPKGKSTIVVQATDPEGYVGTVQREVEVSDTQLFLMALADGSFGQLRGKGYLEGAGMKDSKEYYTEGRVAYYLKGVIAGKYLITSAFDTGTNEFNKIFKDLDAVENDRLLTNLDPDKIYPVYGDDSTIVYDAQSQGKFYLAIDSEAFNLLVGNYGLSLSDTELSAYNRTLYGGKLTYQSVSRTKYGEPDTNIVLFGAEVQQAHVRDELRATGGSLYFLSQSDVIEGSEQISIVIRDKNTGLVLARLPQQQDVDYTIKYPEGRVLFDRPVSSVVEDDSLIDKELLSGNPVFIEVDYETHVKSFEKTASGGRIRQQIGDHVSIGGTYVKDELASGEYELKGTDAEIRLGKNTRLIGEYAETEGADSLIFFSEDGGLTYTDVTPTGMQKGKAWKAAVELDLGEWFDHPGRVQVGGYIKRLESGFASSGNFSEQGTQKTGANINLQLTSRDRLLARYDRDERVGGGTTAPGGLDESNLATVQWRHEHGWWGITGEYQNRELFDTSGDLLERQSFAAARLKLIPIEKLTTSLEHQQTVTGPENDQTTLGVEYQIHPALALRASGTHGTLGQAAEGGAVLTIGETRIYLTERVTEDGANRATSTVLGAENGFGQSGKIYSEYQWEHSEAGDRNLSVTGAKKRWDMTQGLQFLLKGEYAQIDSDTVSSDRYTVAPGLLYIHPAGFKATTQGEVRRERGDLDRIQYLTTLSMELKLNPDFTLMGKYRYSVTRNLDEGEDEAEFEEHSVGLAYRPVTQDWFNGLARYTRLSDQRPLSLGETQAELTSIDVASIEWSLQLTRYLEWVEKDAARIKTEETGGRSPVKTHTYLSIHRLNLRLWKSLDFGLEYRILLQKEADDQREGFLTEFTWEFIEHLRAGAGYNFTDFSDNEFSDNDYSVQGWFVRLQGRF